MRRIASAIFLGSALATFYIVAGYPAILMLRSRNRRLPLKLRGLRKSVSVILPVYNGEHFIARKLRSILELDYPRELLEIIVVSDGSTDGTETLVRSFGDRIRLIVQARAGKAAALNAGMADATGEILVLTDVRQELEARSVALLVESFADESVGAVGGDLALRASAGRDQNIGRYRRFEAWLRDRLQRIDSTFGCHGALYAIRRELAVELPRDVLLDDMFLPMSAFMRGYRLIVEPKAVALDYATDLKAEFNRKVRTMAGNYQLIALMPSVLGPQNRLWFHFMSYKVGRLALPWGLIAMATSAPFLPRPFAGAASGLQMAFYGLAAIDRRIPAGSPIKRLSSPANAFVIMMIAILRGLSVFFVSPLKLWKETAFLPPGAPDGESEDERLTHRNAAR